MMSILLLRREQPHATRGSWSLQHPRVGGTSRGAGTPVSPEDAVLPGTGSEEGELRWRLSPRGRSKSTGGQAGERGGVRHGLLKPWQRMLHLSPAQRGLLNRFCIFLININGSGWPNEDERAFKVGIIAPVWAIKHLRIALRHGKTLQVGGSVREDGGS